MSITGTGVKIVSDRLQNVVQEIMDISRNELMIGIPENKSARDGETITNAQLGYIHENGSPAQNIPARPFLKPGVEKCREKLIIELKAGAQAGLSGKPGAVEQSMNRAGIIAQNEVREYITKGEGFEPLATQTLEQRKRQGAKGTKPLIRTGQLRRSITYVIRRK